VSDIELTHLSFDERMAYYKQKYAGSADAEPRTSSAGKRPPRRKTQERVDAPDVSTAQSGDKRQTAPANQSTRPVKGKGTPASSKPDTQSGRGSAPDAARRKDTPTERQPDRRKGISGKEIADSKPAGGKPPARAPEKPEQRADGSAAGDSAASGGGKASKGILSRIFGFLKK
jgi:hypothetical protein